MKCETKEDLWLLWSHFLRKKNNCNLIWCDFLKRVFLSFISLIFFYCMIFHITLLNFQHTWRLNDFNLENLNSTNPKIQPKNFDDKTGVEIIINKIITVCQMWILKVLLLVLVSIFFTFIEDISKSIFIFFALNKYHQNYKKKV